MRAGVPPPLARLLQRIGAGEDDWEVATGAGAADAARAYCLMRGGAGPAEAWAQVRETIRPPAALMIEAPQQGAVVVREPRQRRPRTRSVATTAQLLRCPELRTVIRAATNGAEWEFSVSAAGQAVDVCAGGDVRATRQLVWDGCGSVVLPELACGVAIADGRRAAALGALRDIADAAGARHNFPARVSDVLEEPQPTYVPPAEVFAAALVQADPLRLGAAANTEQYAAEASALRVTLTSVTGEAVRDCLVKLHDPCQATAARVSGEPMPVGRADGWRGLVDAAACHRVADLVTPVYSDGALAEVAAASGEWHRARVRRTADGAYAVVFDSDGEEWSSVPPADIRPVEIRVCIPADAPCPTSMAELGCDMSPLLTLERVAPGSAAAGGGGLGRVCGESAAAPRFSHVNAYAASSLTDADAAVARIAAASASIPGAAELSLRFDDTAPPAPPPPPLPSLLLLTSTERPAAAGLYFLCPVGMGGDLQWRQVGCDVGQLEESASGWRVWREGGLWAAAPPEAGGREAELSGAAPAKWPHQVEGWSVTSAEPWVAEWQPAPGTSVAEACVHVRKAAEERLGLEFRSADDLTLTGTEPGSLGQHYSLQRFSGRTLTHVSGGGDDAPWLRVWRELRSVADFRAAIHGLTQVSLLFSPAVPQDEAAPSPRLSQMVALRCAPAALITN